MLTIITPTGARPEAFTNCVKQMLQQTVQEPVHWVIVDDGPDPCPSFTILGWKVQVVRPEPVWRPGDNTLARNLLAALDIIDADARVVIVEDDDGYQPWWVHESSKRLRTHDLVGEMNSLYTNLESGKSKEMNNRDHASLCTTSLKGEALQTLREVCESGSDLIDVRLWNRTAPETKMLYEPNPRGVFGLKGWPGRPGIGMGHRL